MINDGYVGDALQLVAVPIGCAIRFRNFQNTKTHADGRRQVLAFTGVSRRGVTVANGTGLGGVAHAGPFKQRGVREGRCRVGDLRQSPGCLPVESTACQELRDLIVEEMVNAHELDPPLVADAGVGPTWAAAKG